MAGKRTKALQRTAHHEAGHAVAAIHWEVRLVSATILPDAEAKTLGEVHHHGSPLKGVEYDASTMNRPRMERMVLVGLAGAAAERAFVKREGGRFRFAGSVPDYRHPHNILGYFIGSEEERSAYMNWLEVRATDFIAVSWDEITAVARALLDRQTLRAKEMRRIVKDAIDKKLGISPKQLEAEEACRRRQQAARWKK